jgi:hypothetical protein
MGRTENPNLKNDYERAFGWYGHFNKSEMALFSECTDRYAQKTLDTADIVREAIFQQLPAYCDDFTTVNNVTPAADTGGAVNAVKAPVEALISKPATAFS